MANSCLSMHQADAYPDNLFAVLPPVTACMDATTPGSRIVSLITDSPIRHRSRKPGDYLFRAGDEFRFLLVLNAGFAKTCYVSEDGREQTTGFHLPGDILGLDAVAAGAYGCDGIAVDTCEVLAIPYDAVIAHGQSNPALVGELYRAFSSEIRNERDLMLSLRSLPAEGRVAAFLLEMSLRFAARGFSATELQLRLTRQEIGSMLGLKLETVSRAFSRFAKLGLINVYLREIVLLDRDGLLGIIAKSTGRDRARRKAPVTGLTAGIHDVFPISPAKLNSVRHIASQ